MVEGASSSSWSLSPSSDSTLASESSSSDSISAAGAASFFVLVGDAAVSLVALAGVFLRGDEVVRAGCAKALSKLPSLLVSADALRRARLAAGCSCCSCCSSSTRWTSSTTPSSSTTSTESIRIGDVTGAGCASRCRLRLTGEAEAGGAPSVLAVAPGCEAAKKREIKVCCLAGDDEGDGVALALWPVRLLAITLLPLRDASDTERMCK